MENDVKSIEDLQKEIDKNNQSIIEAINVLFLDVSSTCVGYSIISMNFTNKQSVMTKAGCIWLDPNWSHAEKYSYIFSAIVNYFWTVEKIDYVVVEQYSINPKKMIGVAIVPEMMGVVKCAANENGIKVSSILPQTWRSILKIKPDVTTTPNGKKERNYKDPTKRYVNSLVSVPNQVQSNITANFRTTPSDLYDAVAIGLAWSEKIGFKNVNTKSVLINDHIGYALRQ